MKVWIPEKSRDDRLRSLQLWLARAQAQHITSFTLYSSYYSSGEVLSPLEEELRAADSSLVTSCMATCCAAAPLEHLHLCAFNLPRVDWLLPVASTLQRLHLRSDRHLGINAPLQRLTALRELTMRSRQTVFGQDCLLPPSLTSISFYYDRKIRGLPPQASISADCIMMV